MNPSDKDKFKQLMDSMATMYRVDKPEQVALRLYFNMLERFPLENVIKAAEAHMADPKSGQFYPKPADFIKHLEGSEITADQIVAAAKLAETPLGIMARIHIGTWDLANLNSFDLKQRAEEVLQLLPKWKDQANAGGYTDHQISIMVKHGVDPCQSFYKGIARPIDAGALSARISHVTKTKRHAELLEPPHREQTTNNPVAGNISHIASSIGKLEHDNG